MRYLLIFLLLCLPAWAATYHAMAADMTGGDGSGSSKANAMDFATVILAATIAPGDIVELYDDMGDIPQTTMTAATCEEGSALSHITIRAFTGETPVINYLFMNGYTVDSFIDFIGIRFDGSDAAMYGCQIYGGGQVTFTDCVFWGPRKTYTGIGGICYPYTATTSVACVLGGVTGSDPVNDVTFTRCTFIGARSITASHVPINLILTDCIFEGASSDTVVMSGFKGLTITGCTFQGYDRRKSPLFNDGGTVSTAFTPGNHVTQAVSGAAGIVDSVAAGVVRFHQTSTADFVSDQTITETETGYTVSGTFGIEGLGHGDSIQINPIIQAPISVIQEDTPGAGQMQFTTTTTRHFVDTGDKVFITGLTGADAAEVNGIEWAATRIDQYNFWIAYDMTGKTIVAGGIANPVFRDLTISRNTFNQTSGDGQNSAIDIFLKTFTTVRADGVVVKANEIYGDYIYGIWVGGINTGANANFVINNNTVFANYYDPPAKGIRLGYANMTTYGGLVVDQMYNNISDAINLTADSDGQTIVVTAHDNNTFARADDMDNWTPSASDIHGTATTKAETDTFFASYFTNYAGYDFTLISGSPAIDTGSGYGATNDRNNVAFGLSPERGCYTYVLPSNLRFVLIRK